ncbi:hypothetical protein KAH94_00650 [bacterium]|nr:hypothetical protein [bacterium]
MKTIRHTLLLLTVVVAFGTKANQEPFKVIMEAKWQDLENDPQKQALFGGKWILAGSITFKKRSSEIIFLDEIQLTWQGDKIEKLIASLYEKNNTTSFLPIEKYLVCDSEWKKSTQQLLLRFNQPLTLGAVNTFYLVLTVPKELENKIKNGRFSIERTGLPLPYRKYVQNHNLSIALNNLDKTTT